MSAPIERERSLKPASISEAAGDDARQIGVVRQWLGISGEDLGTSGRHWWTFAYCFFITAATVGVVNAVNIITITHANPNALFDAVVDEGSSWITFLAFLWIPWAAWRLAPPTGRPRWRLVLHVPGAFAFSLAHVEGFVLVRRLAFWLAGSTYDFGDFWTQFAYEFRKDVLGYMLFTAGFSLIDRLLQQQALIETPGQTLTFDIRDGARLTRVRLDEIVAIASAGNYVEFVLRDGRRLLMRSPLSALENELSPRGFLRTHRSWIVNAVHVTALKPEGSGDYTIELGRESVPLSRRFPEALAKLKGNG